MNWRLEIEKVENGFIASHWEEREDEHVELTVVFEATDGEWGEHEAIIGLFRYMQDYFALGNSKHNAKNIKIELVSDFDI
jgi:hypothetical protein